ncbi:right-handed parallel beta-helix repeat-containing protein [Bartonella sp. WD16.2]|uniref:right-handed parallel beta-helix repeat-containing protein n=1 Tax=Bartonella sp. WD16.2 TaxID=1933904 RepID=UPI000999BF6A|nr:right-handed parallel beta-helix repeat-containing protein [Bartonella sp. WD16.2]AQX20149.1 Right handed beta helix region [Bartonella sp. WD16.2]
MVMRRVLKHHVCLCVLSTAIVAGLALITSQKVYAQVQETKNCMGWVEDSQVLAMHHDKREGKIVCNSSSGTRVLQGVREIDMSNPDEEAVKITGSKADITIGDNLLTVKNGDRSDKSAIRVEQGARLTLKENVSITNVQKVMEVEGSGSVITVNGGTFGLKDKIGARKDGGGRVMIEVKNEGRIVFDKRAVGSNGGSLIISGGEGAKTKVTGIEVSETGGEVEMRKGTTVNFERVTEAIKIKGSGTANIRGEGIINITGKSTGIKMEGSGKADVMSLTINGSGTVTGAEVSSGTLELTKVTLKNVTTGAKVTGSGTAELIKVGITGKDGADTGVYAETSETVTLTSVKISEFAKGVEAKNGQLVINGTSTITVTDGGTGLNITGGSATMMGGSITGTGGAESRSTGVYAGTSETVTLNTVNVSGVQTGVEAIKGQLVINGTSTITVTENGTGVKVSGSATADLTRVGITVTGMYGTGLNITGGSATMTGGSITGSGRAVSRSTGVKMDSSGTVTLNTVNVSGVQTGVEAIKGILKVTEGSIEGKTYGVKVSESATADLTRVGITVTGMYGTGLNITGGSATMTGGSITGKDGNQGTGTGVKMDSSGTVTLNTVNVSNFKTGVQVTKGTLKVTEGSIGGKTWGVKVDGSGRLEMNGGTIEGENGTGVWVQESGTAKLTGVTITGKTYGVYATGGKFEMNMGEITGGSQGVYVSGMATSAELTKVKIKGGGGTGVYAGTARKVTLNMVEISKVKMGVDAVAGELVMNMGTVEFTGNGYGVKVSGTATSAELTKVKITGGSQDTGKGVYAEGTGNVTMTNVDISKVQLGVEVKKGTGTMTITGGSIKEVKWGINMEGGKKLVMDGGTTISFTDGYGVKIQNNVTAELMGTVITGNGGGTGVTAEGTGSVTMNMVEISKVQVGVKVTGNGDLTVKGGEITNVQMGIDMEKGTLVVKDGTRIEFTGTHGVKVGTAVTSATLTGVMIRGDGKGMGVWMEGTGNVTLTSVDISKVQLGVEVKKGTGTMTITGGSMTDVQMGIDMEKGTLVVKDGTRIEFKGKHGVRVGGGVTSATLTNVMIEGTDGKGTGVWMEGTGNVTLTSVDISKVQLGVEVKKGTGTMTITGGSMTDVQMGIDMAGSGTLTVEDGTRIEFKGTHGVKVGGSVTSATLTGVTIRGTGGDGTGTGVHAEGGKVTVTGGWIREVQTGIDMSGSGTLKVEDGTRIEFKGTHGVKVGTAVTSTTLTGVTIRGEGKGTGVWMEGGNLTVKGGEITNVQMGIDMAGSGTLTVEDGTVITVTENGTGVGVWGGTATAELTEVTIKGEGKDKGIGVIMAGKMMTMEKVDISGVGKGVYVMRGEVMMDKVDISGVQTGIEVESGTLEVLGVSGNSTINFTGDGYGVKVGASVKSVRLTDVRITGGDQGSGTGVWANSSEKMTLMLDKVGISGVVMGVYAGSGKLVIREGTISFKAGYGVRVGDKVKSARLMGTQITGDGSGYGVWASSSEKMMMTLEDVRISGVETGIDMSGSGVLKVSGESGNSMISFTGDYGVKVGGSVTSATLTNVQIKGGGEGYGVWAMGKMMTMDKVNISNVQMGVEVKAGNLTITGGSIKEVQTGIAMLGNGMLKVEEKTEIQFRNGYGVYVGEKVQSATLMGTVITGGKAGYGVYVSGGTVMVSGGSIKEVQTGIVMMGKGTLEVKDNTTINFTRGYGVYVRGSVKSAELTGTVITGGKAGYGVYAGGEGRVTVKGGSIKGVWKGVEVLAGDLTVKGGTTIHFMGDGYGVKVGKLVKSTELTEVTITGGRSGMGVWMEGEKMTMTNVDISQVGMGVYAEGKKVMVSGGTIKEVEKGIVMIGDGMLMVKDRTKIEFKGDGTGAGVYMEGSVNARLTGTQIIGEKKQGKGVMMEEGKVMLENVHISEVGTGVEVMRGEAWLKETHLGNVAKGMNIENGDVFMEGGEMSFDGDYGINLARGNAALRGVNMTYTGSDKTANFINVEGGTVLAENVTITGNDKGQGLKVIKGGAVWLKNTTFTNVKNGMTVEGRSTIRMEKGGITFKEGHGIYLSGGQALLSSFNITGQGRKSIGMGVSNSGEVMMRGVEISKVGMGIRMTSGNLVMNRGSIAFNGDYGINLVLGHALLNELTITGSGISNTGTGVEVGYGGKVIMKGVNVSGVAMGVQVTTSSGAAWLKETYFTDVKNGIIVTEGNVIMDKGGIAFKGDYGINLAKGNVVLKSVNMTYAGSDKTANFMRVEGGTVLAENVTISTSGNVSKGLGLKVIKDGKVVLKNTTFTNVKNGMTVTEGVVRMEGGEISFDGKHGIDLIQGQVALMVVKMTYQGNSPTADFIKITGEDTTTNAVETILSKKKAAVVAANLTINGNGHGQGLHVIRGGRVVLMKPTYTDVYNGMTIKEGAVQVLGGEMTFKGEHAVYLNRGHALLTNVAMKYTGDNDKSTFLKVEAKGNALNTADIRGTGIKIEGNGHVQGVHVENGGRVMLESAVFSNIKNGVTVLNGEFWMKKGEIEFKGEHAVSLSTGKVVLNGVIMNYGGDRRVKRGANSTKFIKVEGKGANLTAVKVMIIGNDNGQADGLMVTNGGHVTVNYSHLTKVQNAITIEDGSVWIGNGVVNFGGKHGVKMKNGKIFLNNVQMNYTGNNDDVDFLKIEKKKSILTAINTVINGNDMGSTQGAEVKDGGRLFLIRSGLNKVNTGVTVQNAEAMIIDTSINFKGEHAVSLTVGKTILNQVSIMHTGGKKTDDVDSTKFIKVEGKGANLTANKAIIKGYEDKGNGLHVTNNAKVTLLQSELTGVARGIYIESGEVKIKNSNMTINGENSYGISLESEKSTSETRSKRSRRSADSLTPPHHTSKINKKSEVGSVHLINTVLKVPNNIVIRGHEAESIVVFKDSKVSGDSLLEAKNKSYVMIMANNSSLTGSSHVDRESDAMFYLTNNAQWIITNGKGQDQKKPSSFISGIMLRDDSAIVFDKSSADNYQTLRIGKGSGEAYRAQGGAHIHLNVQPDRKGLLDDDKANRVLIHGDVSGNTKVHIHDASDSEEETRYEDNVNQSISIIQVSGVAKKDSFQLNYGYVTLGNSPYQYHLVAYGPDSEFGQANQQKRLVEGEGEFWDFRLENKYIPFNPRRPDMPIKPIVVPQVPAYLLLPNALFYAGLMDVNNQTELLGTMVTSFDPFFNGKPAFFIRGYGGSHNYTSDLSISEYGYGGKFGYYATDAAVLLNTLENEQNSAFVGVIGTYGKLSLQPQDVEKSKKSNFDHWSITAYASLQHNMGFYVNGLLSYGLSRGNVETLARGKTARITGNPLRAALTGGKAFLTGYEGLVFEPQMQLVYQYLRFNSARDIDGFDIDMGSPNQLTTRLGGRLAQEFSLVEEDSSVSFYGKLHLMSSFGGKQFVQFKDTFQLGAFGSSMEAGVGVQAQLSSQIALHGDVVYQQKLTKAGLSGSTFSGGLRYRF